ncbi:unnamed protein product [Rotaria sp. Silwood1]|nr:unnamed protein product [Rotaria sp. Silwood1]
MRFRSSSDSIQHMKMLKELQKSSNNHASIPLEKWIINRKPRTKCFLVTQLLKLISAILVPLIIGAFTVIQTLHDSRNSQLTRDAEYQRRMDDKLNIDMERRRDDAHAIELRMQQIYDKFLTDTQETLRISNEDLTESDLIFLRARTLTAAEQMDPKRKMYLIQLLYESRLLYTNEYVGNTNYHSVDLDGLDLSNCEFGRSDERDSMRMMNLNGLRIAHTRLRNSSFKNVNLTGSTFENCELTETNFTNVILIDVNFNNAIVYRSNFIDVQFKTKQIYGGMFRDAVFIGSQISTGNKIWYNCDFSSSTFINTRFPDFQIENSIFDRASFVNNGDAEEECNGSHFNPMKIPGWEQRGVLQWLYNMTGSKIIGDNHGGQCLFFGGKRYTSLFDNAIEQIIDVSHLTRLFDNYQTKFTVHADLGGIDDIEDTARIDIQFKSDSSYIGNVYLVQEALLNSSFINMTTEMMLKICGLLSGCDVGNVLLVC